MGPLLKYTNEFWDILDDIEDNVSDKLMRIESSPTVDNKLGIQEVGKSRSDWAFDVKINGKWQPMKAGAFIRFFLTDLFTDKEIYDFTAKYNRLKKRVVLDDKTDPKDHVNKPATQPLISTKKSYGDWGDWYDEPVVKIKGKKIDVPAFKYQPGNVRSTFISLVTETYPHGHEEEVVPFIRGAGLSKDKFGNYYKIIGKSQTMFTSHLDTASRTKSGITLYSDTKNGDEMITSDGTTILGADDKSGVAVMLYMIHHKIPGVYYFFLGEERGGIGSGHLSSVFETVEFLKDIKRCVSFDRRNYFSIITSQMGGECCSDEFAQATANELNKYNMAIELDPTGVYTDSASFIDQIPECTNISVGYFNEHTHQEIQNITYLEKLAKACVKVKWEELPTKRKIGYDEDTLKQYGDFIKDFKTCPFYVETAVVGLSGKTYVKLEVEQTDIISLREDLLNLGTLFNRYDMDPYISFEDEFIYMELVKGHKKSRRSKSKYSGGTISKRVTDDDISSSISARDFNSVSHGKYKFLESWEDHGDDEENYDYPNKSDNRSESIEELRYWISELFKTAKLSTEVTSSGYDIQCEVYLGYREKIGKVLKVFDVASEVKNELLSSYEDEVELYENAQGFPVFRFSFTWQNEEVF